MAVPRGVGIIGAGPGVSALHLPTLARLPEQFGLARIVDGGSGRAGLLAERHGVHAARDVDELLADESVEVVAVCSPPSLHAAHVIAAAEAGKRGVLCEKPLGSVREEVEQAVEACRRRGVALIAGTNHLYEPAWGLAKHHLLAREEQVRAVTVTLVLPPNGRYHEVVTEWEPEQARTARSDPDLTEPRVAAAVLRQLMLGLAVHDLPLVRDLLPTFERVVFARPVAPIGYVVGFIASGVPVHLTASMLPDGPEALWRVGITTDREEIDVEFPPSFVQAGGAVVTVRDADGRRIVYPPGSENGYLAEWRALSEVLDGASTTEYDELAADALYAIELADGVEAHLLGEGV